MEIAKWWPWYRKIIELFRFDESKDRQATYCLENLLRHSDVDLASVRKEISNRTILVFGAGPSLLRNIRQAKHANIVKSSIVLCADGATTALLHEELNPDFIITDLDGKVDDLLTAHEAGSVVVAHSHGDNLDKIQRYVPMFKGNIIGSTQIEPTAHVFNFGGFTDGDRCAFFAEEFGAKRIILAGMDFGGVIGKYSKALPLSKKAFEAKMKKFQIAQELLTWLSSWSNSKIVNSTGKQKVIPGIPNVTFADLARNRN